MNVRGKGLRVPATALVPMRALRAVAAVVERGGISRAAPVLHQSPAALTRGIQDAERMLGLALFERGPRGMAATPAGEALAMRVERALAALATAAQGLRAHGAPAAVAALPRLVGESQLQALLARAAHPTEAAAAASLGISQPALNQALRRLEHAARVPLYERVRTGARLNEAGEWLLRHAKVALAELRIGHEEVARWHGRADAHVAVGALPMACDVLVPRAVARALSVRPDLRATVTDGTYESLTRALREADIDFMVGPLRGDAAAADLSEQVLFVDRFVAVVRQGHPLLRTGRRASLPQLARFPWIGPLPDTPAQVVFERLRARLGARVPAVTLNAHNSSVIRSMLFASDHVAFLSPVQVQGEVASGRLAHASAPLAGTERAIGITQRRDTVASSAAQAVLDALRQVADAARPLASR